MEDTIIVYKNTSKLDYKLYSGTVNIKHGFEYFVEAIGGLAYYFDKAKKALIIF